MKGFRHTYYVSELVMLGLSSQYTVLKKHNVIVFGSKPEKISKHLKIIVEQDVELHTGEILLATSNAEKAFLKADVIFVTMPAYCMQEIAAKNFSYVSMKIALIPGTGWVNVPLKNVTKEEQL